MVRGQPDFGMYAPKVATAAVSDMGEVAARLGSIVTFDRRGDVVDLDDFEAPVLKWEVDTVGADGYAILDSTSVRSGGQAVKIQTHNNAAGRVTLSKRFPVLRSKQLGLEISFSKLVGNHWFIAYLSYYTGVFSVNAGFHIDYVSGELFVFTTAGAWEKVADELWGQNEAFTFDTIKIVVDFDTHYYKRLLFNTNEYNLSEIPIRSTPAVLTPFLETQLILDNTAAVFGNIWLDDYILTQNEP